MTKVIDFAPLKRGDKNEGVRTAQRALSAAGFSLTPDADYGGLTKTAVAAWAKTIGIEADGQTINRDLASRLDAIPLPVAPEPNSYWFLLWGLGDKWTSSGMDVFGRGLRAGSNRRIVAPTVSWGNAQSVIDQIKKLPTNALINLAGNSLGANKLPVITNACPERKFTLVVGEDPTWNYFRPPFGKNVAHVLQFKGANWFNPLGHGSYTFAFPGQGEIITTYVVHQNIDDDRDLMNIAYNRAARYGV